MTTPWADGVPTIGRLEVESRSSYPDPADVHDPGYKRAVNSAGRDPDRKLRPGIFQAPCAIWASTALTVGALIYPNITPYALHTIEFCF